MVIESIIVFTCVGAILLMSVSKSALSYQFCLVWLLIGREFIIS